MGDGCVKTLIMLLQLQGSTNSLREHLRDKSSIHYLNSVHGLFAHFSQSNEIFYITNKTFQPQLSPNHPYVSLKERTTRPAGFSREWVPVFARKRPHTRFQSISSFLVRLYHAPVSGAWCFSTTTQGKRQAMLHGYTESSIRDSASSRFQQDAHAFNKQRDNSGSVSTSRQCCLRSAGCEWNLGKCLLGSEALFRGG